MKTRNNTNFHIKYNYIKAFTLIELSIVILIIGLLVASIVAGKDMIRNAELKTVMSQVVNYKAAVSQFNLIYSGLPGDMTTATSFWPSLTANGDGNNQIAAETSDEAFRALQQLSLAKLISGTYSGTSKNGGASDVLVIATEDVTGNVGRTRIKAGAIYIKCCSTTDFSRTLNFKNHISVFIPSSTTGKRDGIFTPIEAYDLDKKMDDGIPDTGFVGGSGSFNPGYFAANCYSGTGSSSSYITTTADIKNNLHCQMQFAYDW